MIEKIAAKGMHAQDFLAWHPSTDAHGQFGAGGVIKGPVKAILGEAGPEVVVPMKKQFMNKKVKDVAKHFVRKEMQKSAAKDKEHPHGYYIRRSLLQKKKQLSKKPPQHGGFEEKNDGTVAPNTSLGARQGLAPGAGYGAQSGSLHSGGWHEGASVRGGSTPSLR